MVAVLKGIAVCGMVLGRFFRDGLYEAMLFLDDKLKEVLILKYWYLLSRRDIAKILNVSEKTITNWKNKAFKLIKNYKERRLECDIRGP